MAHANAPSLTDYSTTTAPLFIEYAAVRHGVPYEPLLATLECESEGFQNIQSEVPNPSGPNGREDSWGVAQINLPYHKDITKEQALDPLFAIDWTARQFALGNASLWTCYRLYEARWHGLITNFKPIADRGE